MSHPNRLPPVRVVLDRGKLRELALSVHDDDPVWHDEKVASAAGFDRVPVQPTAGVLVDHWREGGALATAVATGLDPERLLHGEVEWEYFAPVRLGDELTARSAVTGVSEREGKRGGAMTIATVETEFRDPSGQLVMVRRDSFVEPEGAG